MTVTEGMITMPTLTFLEIILLALATFRLTHLFVFDEITNIIRKPFHEVHEDVLEDGTVVQYVSVRGKGLRRFVGKLLSCYWCLGIWVAAFLLAGYVLFPMLFWWIISILAIAGFAALVEAVVQKL